MQRNGLPQAEHPAARFLTIETVIVTIEAQEGTPYENDDFGRRFIGVKPGLFYAGR